MVPEPRVDLARLRDRGLELTLCLVDRFVEATPRRPSATRRSGTDEAQSPARMVSIERGWASSKRDVENLGEALVFVDEHGAGLV